LEAPFGALAVGGPAGLQAWAQGSPAVLDSGVSRRRWPGWRGARHWGRRPGPLPNVGGRTARAAAAAPFPRTRRQPVSAVTHHQLTTPKPKRPGAVLPAPGDPVAAKAPI